MQEQTEATISCPSCGETLVILVDLSVSRQCYIEDCQVCRRPINIDVTVDPDGGVDVGVSHDGE